ncbi:flagellar protein G [Natrinema versiforme]|uniref:Flagellar protein G n=1 Tax=Natrinema versiforme TaxID=88724 RepID=A0A4V1FYL3_9EURY|nr:flagellar protein G [Natrinema versiforme]QCS41364.1 flagellar protein G [Natrinema versiforme]
MAGDSVSTLILFIAAMLVAAGVAGTLVTNVNELSNSVDTQSADVTDKIDTDIEIISDPGSDAVYNSDGAENVTLLVKNTGQKTLADDGTGLDVLVNGSYISDEAMTVTVQDDGGPWRRGTVAELEIDQSLATGAEHRVQVTVNGAEEVFEFYVS